MNDSRPRPDDLTSDDLEGMADQSWCHKTYRDDEGRRARLCETADPSPVGPHGINPVVAGRCSSCGRPKCPDCLFEAKLEGWM